jgi:hypothetical protein
MVGVLRVKQDNFEKLQNRRDHQEAHVYDMGWVVNHAYLEGGYCGGGEAIASPRVSQTKPKI